ncbi:M23 family metallopeptidase [Halomicronema sp. CCY15110]|uniref:M23 family metallopeptidase n=1 Tax=Halomicronema sp. CCY15110 TaxID=2767773 RepID=UPI00194E4186|nr:M23 family metallopeptidase [Halomicronema sp. CCY15110]
MLSLIAKAAIVQKLSKPQPTKPDFDALSPDLQWQIVRSRERAELLVQLGAIALVGILLTPMVVPQLNQHMDTVLHDGVKVKVGPITVWESEPVLEQMGVLPPTSLEPVEVGDEIGGFRVNSGYGMRIHPIYGDERMHNGVDLPTPTGTALYTPAARSSRVKVDCKDQPGGAGKYAEITSPDIPGKVFVAMHLSKCITGLHHGGAVIAATGNTGASTGPHLHWEQIDSATGQREHPQKGFLQWALTGQQPKTLEQINQGAVPLQSLIDDELLKCAIGNAEGTMHDDCSKNPAYFGHTDPGNGAANLGAFSYQHGASSPQEADAKQIERLRKAEQGIQQKAVEKFGQPLSQAALANALDLWNQAPLAGDDFVKHLRTADPSPQEIIDARSRSFVDPETGRLDAPGLGNSEENIRHDQTRRTDEVLEQVNP